MATKTYKNGVPQRPAGYYQDERWKIVLEHYRMSDSNPQRRKTGDALAARIRQYWDEVAIQN